MAASRTHIAVTTLVLGGHHSVHLFDAVSRARLWTMGGPQGSGPRQLSSPVGVRFTVDGARVAVADMNNSRIVVLSVADGSPVGHVPTPGIGPRDVEEAEGGWLVATGGGHSVALVPAAGGEPIAVVGGVEGSGEGQFSGVYSLALVPGLGLLVPDAGNDRFQVFRS